MSQQPSLAERTKTRSDDLRAAWDLAVASGAIRSAEVKRIGPIVADVCRFADLSHRSQQAGVALLRLGPESRRTQDMVRDLERADDPAIQRPEPQGRLQRQAEATSLRMVHDYGRDDTYIVWEPGEDGFCDLVSVDACTCFRFRRWGRCPHHTLVVDAVQQARIEAKPAVTVSSSSQPLADAGSVRS